MDNFKSQIQQIILIILAAIIFSFPRAFANPIAIAPLKNILEQNKIEYIKFHDKIKMNMVKFPIASSPNSTWEKPLIPESFILRIPNGKVYSNNGIIIVNNNLIKELIWPWSNLKKGTKILNTVTMPELKFVPGKVAVVTQEGHNNYYHWITEILPKIIMLQKKNIDYDWLYLPKLTHSFMKETLDILGVDDKKIMESTINTYIQADIIIAPSFASASCYSPKWVIDALRDKLLPKDQINSDPKEKIFISREKAPSRKITNEEKLYAILEEKGFQKYYLEDLSFKEQVKLFSNAKIIIAAHGAGLTNLIFAQARTKIYELFQEREDETFWYLSQELKLQHECIKTTKFSKRNGGYTDTKLPDNIFEYFKNNTKIN